MSVYMSISRDIVRECGANAAILHQQIYWVVETETKHGVRPGDVRHREGWLTGKLERLAWLTGLTEDQVRGAAAKLVEAGLLERRKFHKNRQDQTCSYKAIEPHERSGDSPNSDARSGEPTNSTSGESTRSSISREGSESKPSPTPSEKGGQGSLLDASNEETPVREQRKRAAANPMLSASFDEWWARYPSGKKGDRRAALRAFTKAIAVDSIATLDKQLANYIEARQLYASHFGGWAAPLRHASSWLNQARESYSEPWTLEDCRYWPAPAGRSWDAASPRGESREELMARELAREAREAEERAARLAEFEDEDDEEWV